MNELYGGEEVSSNEFFILRLLKQGESKTVSELSKELNVTPSHITAVSDKLMQKGFIERHRSNKDRRVVELSITSPGEELVDKLMVIRKEYLTRRFGNLENKELEQLIFLLQKVMEK